MTKHVKILGTFHTTHSLFPLQYETGPKQSKLSSPKPTEAPMNPKSSLSSHQSNFGIRFPLLADHDLLCSPSFTLGLGDYPVR